MMKNRLYLSPAIIVCDMSSDQSMGANNITKKQHVPNLQLRKEREQRGWTHKDVADKIGLPDSHTVSRWERGHSVPGPHYRQALSRLFEKSLEELNLLQSHENEIVPSSIEGNEQVLASPDGGSTRFIQPPPRFTSFVGRERELIEICELLKRSDVYLLTLLGTGGIGKTSLATQVALKMSEHFTDGICFVSLAALRDAALVLPTIAEALGIQGGRGLHLGEQIKAVLREKHVLLVIDNFEHVMTAAPLVEELLSSCPDVKVLATSREALHISAEREYSIVPLATPDLKQLPEPEALMEYASIVLFVQRVQAMQANFKMTRNNAAVIAELCVRLDGLPLAIELAARMKLLSPQALLARFSQRLFLLKSDLRQIDERHRTLYQTIKWSYDLLDAREQWLFRHLSVFVSGTTLETIEVFFGSSEQWTGESGEIVELVRSLLNKSLLQQIEQDGEDPRFLMLEVIREFGLDCLRACHELEESKRSYALYFLAEVEQAAPQLKGPLQATWLQRLEQEHDNLRAALNWFIEIRDAGLALRFCEAFGKFCGLRGYWSEEQRCLKAVLALPQGPELRAIRARVLRRAGHLAYRLRDLVEARALQEESVRYSREIGDKENLAGALSGLGRVLYKQNEQAAAAQLFRESVEVARQCTDRWALANALESRGQFLYHQEGKIDEARSLLEESLSLARQLDDSESISRFLTTLVELEIAEGNRQRAQEMAQESYDLAMRLGTRPLIALALDALGESAFFEGNYGQAMRSFELRIVMARELGDTSTVIRKLVKVADILLAQGDTVQAATLLEENLELLRQQKDMAAIMTAMNILGDVKRKSGDMVRAGVLYRDVLMCDGLVGDRRNRVRCLIGLIHCLLVRGDLTDVAYLFGYLESKIGPKLPASLYPAERIEYTEAEEKVRGLSGEERCVQARQAGQEATLEDVMKRAGSIAS
jgi:predicted ATPase/transcriptional regulator with XRE-family HTH domain